MHSFVIVFYNFYGVAFCVQDLICQKEVKMLSLCVSFELHLGVLVNP